MELRGAKGGFLCGEEEYIEMKISPAEELPGIESSINEALKSGADILPAVVVLEVCRELSAEGTMEDYDAAMRILSAICRDLPRSGGGRLKPVGDYLGFYID